MLLYSYMFQFLLFPIDTVAVAILLAIFWVVCVTFRYQKSEYAKTGTVWLYYPLSFHIFLAPVYEEMLFRGILLNVFLGFTGVYQSTFLTSILFGLWHVKNRKYQPISVTVHQVLYTAFIFGPVMALLTVYTGNILLAVLLHSINNYLAPIFNKKFGFTT